MAKLSEDIKNVPKHKPKDESGLKDLEQKIKALKREFESKQDIDVHNLMY